MDATRRTFALDRAKIPKLLTTIPRWLTWQDGPIKPSGKFDKFPINTTSGIKVDGTNPANWISYNDACAAYDAGRCSGIGIVLCDEPVGTWGGVLCGAHQYLIALDFDQCGQDPNIMREVKSLQKDFGEIYGEISPSGNGVRLFALSRELTKGGNTGKGRELYSTGRFMTVTGIGGRGNVVDATEKLAELSAKWFPQKQQPTGKSKAPNAANLTETPEAIAKVKAQLAHIDADCSYEMWRNILWAVLSTGWSCREELARTWSASGKKYEAKAFDQLVKSFDPSRGISLGTLEYWAREGGWMPVAGAKFAANDDEQDPQELAETLPPVPDFLIGLLPKDIGAYVEDVAERMSCPVDFPGIAAIVVLSAAIGSRIHCKPYANGTWCVPAGAWGMLVSPPGTIKSPPASEVLRPLKQLDKLAAAQYTKDIEQYDIDKQIYENAVKAAIKVGARSAGQPPPVEPVMTRYLVNDSTYEMLVKIAAANPDGFLIWRDELVGWFHSLNKENQKEARGLYLTGWTGTESYATDRIGRGHVRADCVNLSLLGTIQPNVLRGIVHDAVAGGAGDDGLVARFQLAVYPNPVRNYVKVDRLPDLSAMHLYHKLVEKLVVLDPNTVGALFTHDGQPYLPFDEQAQAIFDDWRQELEERIRDPKSDEHPAMLSHLGKYRSLFPKLALVLHLADGNVGPIGMPAALRAKKWTEYLEAHARRIYHTASNRTMQSAVALANKIKAGRLTDGFTRSDVLIKDWAGLRTAEEVTTAITVLRDGNWLSVIEDKGTGGRPAERHYINQKVKRDA